MADEAPPREVLAVLLIGGLAVAAVAATPWSHLCQDEAGHLQLSDGSWGWAVFGLVVAWCGTVLLLPAVVALGVQLAARLRAAESATATGPGSDGGDKVGA